MSTQTDQELLRDYVEHRSEPAFGELVRRHVDLVHSAALRMLPDSHQAQDVTQAVFVALAQNARQLTLHPVLSGWLHRSAQNLAVNVVRSNVRRQTREQEAAAMNELLAIGTDAPWEHIAPHLDAALGELSEPDRDAVMLRYFEKKSAQEMAGLLGISDEAAQKRVTRAVERLRDFFAKRGVTIGASGLVITISANAVQAAPADLAAAISAATLAGATATTSTAVIAIKTIAMTTLQKAVIITAFITATGAGVYQAHQAAQLRKQNEALQQSQTALTAQLQQSQSEHDAATTGLADNSKPESNPDQAELLRLRGEVGQLRQQLQGLPSTKAELLKQKLEMMPDKKIPELKFLTDKDWINASWNADLNTDDGVRLALSKLRDESVDTFLNLARKALKKYLAANDDMLPADLLALKPYFDEPVTDDMLQRYAFMQTGKISSNSSQSVVKKAVYADPDYDSNQEMSLNGAGGGSFNRLQDAINDAAREYASYHNYQAPTDPSQIAPFLRRTIDADIIQKYLNQFVVDPPSPDEAVLAPVLSAYFNAHGGSRLQNLSDLLPYITTPEQQTVFQKIGKNNSP